MENLLKKEKRPYLKQHENNPVHWYPWGKNAINKAKELKKPIFLSVGYASCHWCHVMAHESFEDINTAKVMNEKFINIKVDREERPDLDFVFQKSLAVLTGTQGGWPLSMFLDENGVPFTGGTYFPPKEMQGRPNFIKVLNNVSEVYSSNRSESSRIENGCVYAEVAIWDKEGTWDTVAGWQDADQIAKLIHVASTMSVEEIIKANKIDEDE